MLAIMRKGVTEVSRGAVEEPSPRERLLDAATELLAASAGKPVSTREITTRAGVTAPTLYHHFGDKDGLMDAVAVRGFEEFVQREAGMERSSLPMADVQRLWDVHVQFGLSQPQVYSLMFGSTGPRKRPVIVQQAERLLETELSRVAEAGALAVPPLQAARAVLAANIGVTLMLIADTAEDGQVPSADDVATLTLSVQTRDAVLRSVVTNPALVDSPSAGVAASGTGPPSFVAAAIALNATLQSSHPDQLSGTEMELFLEWLHRLSTAGPGA